MQEPMRVKNLPATHIFDGIHWIGAQNPHLRGYGGLMETPIGTSYNSYLVMGVEHYAIVDTVKGGFLPQSMQWYASIPKFDQTHYIVLLHLEPDQANSVRDLIAVFPEAEVVCSKNASLYLPHITNKPIRHRVVQDGDRLELGGGRALRFLSAPFLPWPDTLFAYEERAKALFTSSAFSAHVPTPGKFPDAPDPAFLQERRAYYEAILKPYAPYALRAIRHVRESVSAVEGILPAYGPTARGASLVKKIFHSYELMARKEPHLAGNKLFVGYTSCYGYTRRLALRLAERAEALGLEVTASDLAETPLKEAIAHVEVSDAIAIGSPTVHADLLPSTWALLTSLSVPRMRGRVGAVFGSYGWSGEAIPLLAGRFAALGCPLAAEPVQVRFRPVAKDLERMDTLADAIAGALREKTA